MTHLVPLSRWVARSAQSITFLFRQLVESRVETKLWRNPEAAREVLAQILDYAKRLSSLSYREFERQCKKAKAPAPLATTTLFRLVTAKFPTLVGSETEFIDSIDKTLRDARFMLIIVGDGIRENLEDMVGLLHRQPQMLFTFGLVEMSGAPASVRRCEIQIPKLKLEMNLQVALNPTLKRGENEKHPTPVTSVSTGRWPPFQAPTTL